jgi:phosphomannomutase/phosphoglucomutase
MNPDIFREYDIRGIAGKDIQEADVESIGKAYGTLLCQQNKTNISVGRDCRATSDRFSQLFIKGIVSTGCDVIDIGVCPTPVLYFSIHHLKTQGGAMVTASHNPPEYNGFKLMSGFDSIHSQGLQEIRKIIEAGEFETGEGTLEKEADMITPYSKYLQDNIKSVPTGADRHRCGQRHRRSYGPAHARSPGMRGASPVL